MSREIMNEWFRNVFAGPFVKGLNMYIFGFCYRRCLRLLYLCSHGRFYDVETMFVRGLPICKSDDTTATGLK